MKTKFNTTNLPFVAMITTCLMAMMLVFAGFSIKANAAETVTFEKTAPGVVKVTGVESGKLPCVIHVITQTQTTDAGYTITPGYYFVNANSIIADYPDTTSVNNSYDLANNTLTTATQKAFKKGTFDIVDNTVSSTISLFTGTFNSTLYYNGDVYGNGSNTYYYDGTWYKAAKGNLKAAKANGIIKGTYYNAKEGKFKAISPYGYYIVKGKVGTAVVNLKYYAAGVFKSTTTGWIKIGSKVYYVKKGTAVTGWNKLKSYGKGVKSYQYLFSKQGVLYTDLINNYFGYSKFIKKKGIKIICNKTTHNLTFYIKMKVGNSKVAEYVPVKTVICATARKKGDTPNGTFRLEKTWRKRWFVYTKTNGAPYRYYQWAVHIKGTPTLIHSSTYRKAKATSLRTDLYNKLGTSCTTHCIRIQARYAKMVYDISSYKPNIKNRVPVQIITSVNEGPFGHVGLTKVSSGTKWDPTDPNKK